MFRVLSSCDMLPSAPSGHGADDCLADTKLRRQRGELDSSDTRRANLSYRVLCQFRARVVLAFQSALSIATLFYHVAVVVCRRSKEQVIRVYANRSVATVEYSETARYWAAKKFPCVSVGPNRTTPRFDCELPVAVAIFRGLPQPARVGLVDVFPESTDWITEPEASGLVALGRAVLPRLSAARLPALPTLFVGNVVVSHVTSLGSLVRGAGRCFSTAAPRSLYPSFGVA